MRKKFVAIPLVASLLFTAGCGELTVMYPGKNKVTTAAYGLWKANNAVKGCLYYMTSPEGAREWTRTWSIKNSVPVVQLGTGNKNHYFSFNDKCGKFTK